VFKTTQCLQNFSYMISKSVFSLEILHTRRHDTQQNDIQINNTEHNMLCNTQHSIMTLKHNTIECCYAECYVLIVMLGVIMPNAVMLSVVFALRHYAKCYSASIAKSNS